MLIRYRQALAAPVRAAVAAAVAAAAADTRRPSARRRRAPAALLAALALLGVAACAAPRRFAWVEELPPAAAAEPAEYVIGPGDLLSIRVHGQDAITSTVRVREDGRISLALVADPMAAGLTPATLADLLESQLKTYVNKPVVTVALEARRPNEVSVLGHVVTPGVYQFAHGTGLLGALAQARGLTPRADRDAIYVLRAGEAGGKPERIRFRYASLLQSEGPASAFQLRDSDVILVE